MILPVCALYLWFYLLQYFKTNGSKYLVFEYLNKLGEMKATALTENAAAQYWFPLTLYLQTFQSKYPLKIYSIQATGS